MWQPYPTDSRLAKGSASRIGVDSRFLEDQVHSKMFRLPQLYTHPDHPETLGDSSCSLI